MNSRNALLIFMALLVAPVEASVLRVSQQASGTTQDGQTWQTAFLTIPGAVAAASQGDEIWVAKGTYLDTVTVSQDMSLYGGFAGTETERSQRNASAYPTILSRTSSIGACVSVSAGVGPATVIDGFTLTVAVGVALSGGSPTISHNIFRDAPLAIMTSGSHPASSALILDNRITNVAQNGYAIGFGGGDPVIQGNQLEHTGIEYYGAASGGWPEIIGNTFTSTYQAILAENCTCNIEDNVVLGAEVHVQGASATIVNNTIVGAYGTGLTIPSAVQFSVVANNIVAFNRYGIAAPGSATADPIALFNNCVYGNSVADYTGTKPATGFQGNVSVDPQFVNRNADFHLAATSPLIDAGNDAYVQYGDVDVAGNPRIQGAHADIGAYEFGGSIFTMGDVAGALRLWGGLSAATPDLAARLNANGDAAIDLSDAVRLARKAAGLDPNP